VLFVKIATQHLFAKLGAMTLMHWLLLMVGGNRPGITRTLSIAIYEDVQALDYTRAWYSSLVLLTVALVALGILSWAEQRLRKQ
jgi:ABC-type molybdate transport system permease subunit